MGRLVSFTGLPLRMGRRHSVHGPDRGLAWGRDVLDRFRDRATDRPLRARAEFASRNSEPGTWTATKGSKAD
jgi:hypothetical protein